MYKAIIFDLDGTLLDTIDELTNCVNLTLNAHYSKDLVKQALGNGMTKLINAFTSDDLENKVNYFKQLYANNYLDNCKVFDGTEELLNKLQNEGYLLAVLSNKDHLFTVNLINKYFPNIDFTIIQGRQANKAFKPSADTIYAIANTLKLNKNQLLLVGDSEVDIQTAINADIDSIFVGWGYRDINAIDIKVKNIAETPFDIYKIIKEEDESITVKASV